jgi:hypothetical protein
MSNTIKQYDKVINICRDMFLKKNQDYGTAWRILRTSSLTDQIFIKANRIRTIQQTGENKVGESIDNEFVGIINYCAMALIQLELKDDARLDIDSIEVIKLYDKMIEQTKALMQSKNHDYGEAWRDMRISSLTDLILMKLLRVKQIEDNQGKTIASEGIDANYMDMINYSIFALILLSEK